MCPPALVAVAEVPTMAAAAQAKRAVAQQHELPPAEAAAEEAIEQSPEHKTVAELLQRLTAEGSSAARQAAAENVAAFVKENGINCLKSVELSKDGDLSYGLLDKLKAAAEDTSAPLAREGALLAFAALCKSVGPAFEPYFVPSLPMVLERFGDKVTAVREAAEVAGRALFGILCQQATGVVMPVLLEGMEAHRHWQTKNGALLLLGLLTKSAPKQVALCMPDIVPAVSATMVDAKNEVKAAALQAMIDTCAVVGNRDIDPFVPVLISCIARPSEVPDCVHKLGATTFVQTVEAPTLSILVPLLVRGLRERETAVKRKTCVIIDNMAKLVDNPHDAAVFLPRLLPGVARVKEEVASPECRNVASRAHETLMRIAGDNINPEIEAQAPKKADAQVVLTALKELVLAKSKVQLDDFGMLTLDYVAAVCCTLINVKNFDEDVWAECVVPYLSTFISEADANAVTRSFVDRCYEESTEKAAAEISDDEGEELCDCEFSLAYGGKILLNNATLRLKRGRRYGLCGPNGVGKSTLMRAIANGQLDGFPDKNTLRTVYVEHDIDASEATTAVVDFVFEDQTLQAVLAVSKEEVITVLSGVGFTAEMQQMPITSLSGGWKMKLALARAMLMKADIMLLDEPTNHLDVKNVAWLQDYLNSLANVTSILVSHDSGFLDAVCTDIIHYEGRKLRRYKGNLSEFVKRVPEARSYYRLEAASLKFVLPEPGFLEGIKSKDRAILKMRTAGFRYPGAENQILKNVSLQVSLNSRVAVIGPNGAGKSTLIKLLTGELEPQEGSVWKHPNMRVAYVAQHAFHHVEQHLEKTPNQYIQWRYSIGEDRENLSKVSRTVTADEQKKMAEKHVAADGTKRVVDCLLSRRKLKKSYEYEVQWQNSSPDQNSWLTRDKLVEMGFEKQVNAIDVKEAARLGLHTRPLTTAVIEKHLNDLGIEPEFGTHSHIRGLSGGQKVKVVLAAAMWNNPHVLVLDEPTNYLDRESLGALAGAIKDYGGGVVMISHNREFTSALCPETWTVGGGVVELDGVPEAVKEAAKLEWKAQEEMTDAFGNIVKIKQPKKKLSRQEKKKRDKIRKARRDRGEEVSDTEDDEE